MSDESPSTSTTGTEVRVSKFGSDETSLPFVPDAKVSDYLDTADVTVDKGQVVTINGSPATVESAVPEGAVIVIVGKIENG